jgi:hypothetical protein
MRTILVTIVVTLISALALALIGAVLRPKRKDDVMQQAIGDAPRLVRGGYAAMDEQAPLRTKRPS